MSYEQLGFQAEDVLFGEFLQHEEIAASFAAYHKLFCACREKLALPQILSGQTDTAAPELRALRFDGRLAAVELLLHALKTELAQARAQSELSGSLASFLSALEREPDRLSAARTHLARRESAMQVKKDCGVLPAEEEARERRFAAKVRACLEGESGLAVLESEAERSRAAAQTAAEASAVHLENALTFVRGTFGPGQELLIFLTQLQNLPDAQPFLRKSAQFAPLLREVLPE